MLYAGLALLGGLAANGLIFQPRLASYGGDLAGLHRLSAADGTQLAALHLPNPSARYTLFYFHGNAEDLGDSLPLVRQFHAAGFAVLTFDYRGYGLSAGRAEENNVYADTQTMLVFAQQQLGIKTEAMIVVGRSVGGGPAVELAANARVAGLILISPFTSAFRVMTRVKLLPFDQFDNLAKIGRVHCPKLIFHGVADEVIPFAHGQKLFAAMAEPKRHVWIPEVGHNDIFAVAGDQIRREILSFEKRLTGAPARQD
jgi:hypothetical protein